MNIIELLKDKEKMEEFKRTQELRNEYNSLSTWFNNYDKKVVEFVRKEALHNQHLIDEVSFNKEKENITYLHLKAEEKAKRINQLREMLNIKKYEL